MQEGSELAGAVPGPSGTGRQRGVKGWVVAGVVILLLAGGGVAWWLLGSGDDAATAAAPQTSLAEVVRTDMQQVETLDGTLGFEEGEAIGSGMAGTLTWVTPAGTVVSEGDVLYRVEGKPVVLLQGALPAWQSMGLEEVPLTIKSAGTITWLPEVGTTLAQGDVVAKVNEVPVVLLYGALPAYRTLAYGSEGADVQQLETALVALGYDPDGTVTVDEDFDWYTQLMVEDWQAALGLDDTGRVDPSQIMIVSGPITVGSLSAAVGDSVQGSARIGTARGDSGGSEGADVEQLEAALAHLGYEPGPIDGVYTTETQAAVLAWQAAVGADTDGVVDLGEVVFRSGPVRISENVLSVGDSVAGGAAVLGASSDQVQVTVALPADEQDLLAEGDRVTVALPDGTEAAGTVTFVDSVATRNSQTMEVTFKVIVALDDVSVAAGLDQAPVSIDVVNESRTGVLAVPVTALLALSEGGYAVEVDDGDGTTHLVAVEPGLYADNLVEVAADGLQAGNQVVVP
jgi:peptidoglycan hydrolase-like protein with peptidoglycan-binding domain